jgi:hypothetical protein
MEGTILVHFTPESKTINSQNYCDALRKKLEEEEEEDIHPMEKSLARCNIG